MHTKAFLSSAEAAYVAGLNKPARITSETIRYRFIYFL